MLTLFKSRRRKKLRARPVPEAWRRVFLRLPLYRAISVEDQRELTGHVHVFLNEKRFEGARGFVVTDEVALLISAQACLLLLHRDTDYFPRLRSIIVYPDTYVAPRRERRGTWIESEREDVLHGESWNQGVVVLSWKQTQRSASQLDGNNLVLHEFAHQLDEEDGHANGAPILGSHIDPVTWAHVMREEYESLRIAATFGHETLLDYYGAESPAEFFSVATESFFERGREFRQWHPALYEQLKLYYQQDPAHWPGILKEPQMVW
jgi:Mlc titration factor MtfA (ptsG expression regulator)